MNDLKPCPCCGGKAVITKGYTSTLDTWPQGTFHRVFCGACQLRQLFHASPEAAADAWNRRTQPEATAPAQDLSAAIKVARDGLEKISTWSFGWDGDCGVTRVADDTLAAIEAALASSANARFDGSISKLGAPEAFVPSTANALSAGDRVDAELAFLNEWLTLSATPVGAECCGEGVTGAEYMGQREVVCCGSPIAVERGAEEVISAMAARHRELSAILQSQKAK